MRILIADDHELIREGIKRILADAHDIRYVGEARIAHEVIAALEQEHWDMVVLDINLPGRSGLDVLKEIKQRFPDIPVLILSMYPEDQYAVRMIKAGAVGYINKGSAATDLLQAIRKVAAGGKYINTSVAEKLAEAVDTGGPPHTLLSDREFEIFRLLASGKTVGEIALLLSRSVKTISTHRSHILSKMNLNNNAEIMQYAFEHKLLD